MNEVPTLDLHGETQEPAVRRVTDFLEAHAETNCRHVRIVTGSGSHSVAGPVLRTAVQRLLEKRQMDYYRDTPGSFMVQPDTGITLYKEEPSTDTKVVVTSMQTATVRAIPYSTTTITTTRASSWGDDRLSMTPAEVAAEDRAIDEAKNRSLEDDSERQRQEAQEAKLLQQAMEVSKCENDEEAEAKALRAALLLSQKEMERKEAQLAEEEELLLRKAIELSEQETGETVDEEALLQEVLKASEEEATSSVDDDEEEELLRRVMEASKQDTAQPDMEKLMEAAIARSVQQTRHSDDDEDRLVRHALALSLK